MALPSLSPDPIRYYFFPALLILIPPSAMRGNFLFLGCPPFNPALAPFLQLSHLQPATAMLHVVLQIPDSQGFILAGEDLVSYASLLRYVSTSNT